MEFYPVLLVFHIVFAVIWLADVPVHFFLSGFIAKNKNKAGYKKMIYAWLKMINLTGIIGMSGVLVTGIILTIIIPFYSFFQFNGNHWLTTKQIIALIIIFIVGFNIIPIGRKIRIAIENDLENNSAMSEELEKNAGKISNLAKVVTVLVFINFLLAVTHRFLPGS